MRSERALVKSRGVREIGELGKKEWQGQSGWKEA